MTLDQFMNGTLMPAGEFLHPDSMIFDPFEINDHEDQIVEYNGELDPDRNNFNQFSHQLSKNSNYYNEDSFNKYIKTNCYEGGELSFTHSNIRSIPANLTAFMSYMSNIDYDFSVIGFSETWLNSSTIDTYDIDGYSHVGLTRESGKGGGVSLFLCDKMVYCEMPELTMMCDYIECVFVEINYMDYRFIVGVVYRPPNSNTVDFNDSIQDILEKMPELTMMCDYIECVFVEINYMDYRFIVGVVYRPPNSNTVDFNDSIQDILGKNAHHPYYIMGDFNLDLLKLELHRPTEKFLDIMYANSYIPMINRPTRVTRDTCTLIDNIFANNYSIDSHFVSGILKANITDHYILFHTIKDKAGKKDNNNEYKTVRIINESRTSRFIENIPNTDWSVLNSHRDCQTYFTKFYALFKTIYDGSFPLSRVKMRYRNRLPWLTEGLKRSIK